MLQIMVMDLILNLNLMRYHFLVYILSHVLKNGSVRTQNSERRPCSAGDPRRQDLRLKSIFAFDSNYSEKLTARQHGNTVLHWCGGSAYCVVFVHCCALCSLCCLRFPDPVNLCSTVTRNLYLICTIVHFGLVTSVWLKIWFVIRPFSILHLGCFIQYVLVYVKQKK